MTESIHTTLAMNTLYQVIDPEIGLNIVDLGLIYDVAVTEAEVQCSMTLTNRFCPMGEYLMEQVEQQLSKTFPDRVVKVNLTFDPPWNSDKISPEGQEFLNS